MVSQKQIRAITRQELERDREQLRKDRTEDLLVNRFNSREDVREIVNKNTEIIKNKLDMLNSLENRTNNNNTEFSEIKKNKICLPNSNKKSFKNILKSFVSHKYIRYGYYAIGCIYVFILFWNLVMPELKISVEIIKVLFDFFNILN